MQLLTNLRCPQSQPRSCRSWSRPCTNQQQHRRQAIRQSQQQQLSSSELPTCCPCPDQCRRMCRLQQSKELIQPQGRAFSLIILRSCSGCSAGRMLMPMVPVSAACQLPRLSTALQSPVHSRLYCDSQLQQTEMMETFQKVALPKYPAQQSVSHPLTVASSRHTWRSQQSKLEAQQPIQSLSPLACCRGKAQPPEMYHIVSVRDEHSPVRSCSEHGSGRLLCIAAGH